MRRLALAFFGLSFVTALLVSPAAHAQATRTWVSGVGDDVNPCSRTAPCKTFAGTIVKTAAGGEINCLDSGGMGAVTITKSITILCDGVIGGILASGVQGIVINDGAGTAVVVLDGLDIEGSGSTNGTIGINFISGASLHVRNTRIRNFTSTSGHGIFFQPNTTARLIVENVSISNTGTGTVGGAIVVHPASGAAATALITKAVIHRGTFGVVGDTSGGAAGINIVVRDTVANGLGNTAFLTAGANIGMLVEGSAAAASGTGFSASGGSTIRVGTSVITGNSTSVSGNVLSYGDNRINGNNVDAIPSPVPGGSH